MGTADDDRQEPESEQLVTSKYAIGEGSSQGFDFFSSVLAGMLLGLGLDWILDTAPVMVIIGVIAGFVSGFAKLWAASEAIEDEARRRGRL
jgi:F0F1-type ATP synthase assembly protein I